MLDVKQKDNENKTHRELLWGIGAAFELVLEDVEALVAEPASIFNKKWVDFEKNGQDRNSRIHGHT